MVVKKKVNCGFHVPLIPKAPRSDRKRGGFKKKLDGNETCAIELLAAVAGKLLLENEGSSASINEKETTEISVYNEYHKKEVNHYNDGEDDLFKAGDSRKETACVPQNDSLNDASKHVPNQVHQPENKPHSQEASVVSNSDCFENAVTGLKPGNIEGEDASSKFVRKREEEHSHSCWKSCERTTGGGFVKNIGFEEDKIVNAVHTVNFSSPAKSITSPSSKGYTPAISSLKHRFFSLGSSDDDENIFRCNQHSTKVKAYRPIPRRRVRKFLTYKYKKVSIAWKDRKCPNAVRGMWPVCQNRKTYCGQERCQSDILAKKRKLFDQRSVVTFDRGISESFCNVLEKGMKKKPRCSINLGCDASTPSSSPRGFKSAFSSKDSHVRLSIKSLRVPEIYIEVSENATVGSLKRKVLEAVTAMIGGVQVGVRLRGKKIRDDTRSLLQTGIASKYNVGKLGFELETKSVEVPLTLRDDAPFILLSNVSNHSTRPPVSPTTPSASFVASDLAPDPSPQATVINHSDCTHDMVLAPAPSPSPSPSPSPAKSLSSCETESRAIVPYSEMNATPLTVVSREKKAQKSELAQRRTRRPFSVAEVEALVESVENLGTGRWRDVKICAFDKANHRTYVDLKDKWKTLVHTAQIAPQQRRGQPVPQELLDRVLAAHAYWSQHQAKQICKHRDADPSISATEVE